ncbi:MAG TPA: MlaD family protein [Candidatus Dormibacteraeota bacterium]|nr:MlaD family protein [Candidatus Dormibacteraeota bacterium]
MHGSRVNPVISGVATIVVSLVLVISVVISGIPGGPQLPLIGSSDAVLRAQLVDADNLAPHAAVEIAGVKIGEVRSVTGSGNQAIVTMDIFPGNTDIHRDASVAVRPHGLFGPKYVELTPGTSVQPLLANDDVITGTAASEPVDLDQVLQELQAPQRDQLQTTIVELGKAAEGRGDDLNHMLAAAKSLTQLLDSPVQNLDRVGPNLGNTLDKSDAFNASLAQVPLDQVVANTDVTLAALASNSDHLKSILDHANGTLVSLDSALSGEAANLRATIEKLPSFLDAFNRFNDLLSLFGANFTGKEPGYSDITGGIIGAIENVRSAFSSYTPCTPNVGGCPADGKAHYARIQVFNLTPNNPLPPLPCLPTTTINLPVLGNVTLPSIPGCIQQKAVTGRSASATVGFPTAATASGPAVLGPATLTALAGT